MKVLFITLILFIATLVGIYTNQYQAPLIFTYQNWSFAMPVWLPVTAIFVALGSIATIYHFFVSVYLKYQITKIQLIYRKQQHSLELLQTAAIQLIEENNPAAEKTALQAAHGFRHKFLAYFTAAQAAHAQQAWQRRDNYLQLALVANPKAALAITLNQTQLQLDAHQIDACLATIAAADSNTTKYPINAQHPQLLACKYKLYVLTNNTDKLRALLPQIKKLTHKSCIPNFISKKRPISPEELQQLNTLEHNIYQELLRQATHNNAVDLPVLNAAWNFIPKKIRNNTTELLLIYVNSLIQIRAYNTAEIIVRKRILSLQNNAVNNYNQLLELYGHIYSNNISKQITFAETLLSANANNHVLLLALARLCMRQKLWGKARSYLQSSVEIAPSTAAYTELAHLLETLGESQQSNAYYKQGLLAITS